MRKRVIGLVALALGAGFMAGVATPRLAHPAPIRPAVVAVIDTDVPGTRVFHHGQCLGEIPVELTRERLAELGVDLSTRWAATPQADGYGEALILGQEDVCEFKLMLQVPDADAGQFLTIDTPWGRRTRMAAVVPTNNADGTQRLVASFDPAERAPGVRFRVRVPDRQAREVGTVRVELVLENAGPDELAGMRPSARLVWAAPDTPWRFSSHRDVPLPPDWERVPSGRTVTAAVDLPAPGVAGDYEVFATLAFQRSATSRGKAPPGGFSNTALLRFR